ncbi:HelD family protein [Streptomyces mexicanus]|uniref:AAA family ATPase n=1 Tax=Streptomyces mexicanus TaxID=178566 RepID=A0A7X1I5S0_9ACTN|nr:ATP-binding domain-containing protein [Streptomyces mexicanus]MBC2868881.1 AAA family ATPase [Streptomyces mexicanus]
MGVPAHDEVIAYEQEKVDFAYHCYEARLARMSGTSVAKASASGKDGVANRIKAEEQAAAYDGLGGESLVIGRVDARDPREGIATWYVGRRTVWDEAHDQVVVNWTNELAKKWFDASPEAPGEVVLRRRLICSQRVVQDYTDDIALAAAAPAAPGARNTVPGPRTGARTAQQPANVPEPITRGENAGRHTAGRPVPTPGDIADIQRRKPQRPDELLLRDLLRSRSGRMRDIVETIQRDQMALVTGAPSEILVIQGGPGTGKSAVGLHRVTWLVNNDHFHARDILVIGPHQRFLDYVGQVLPTLGTRDVNAVQLSRLWDGDVRGTDSARTRLVKSDERMAAVLRRRVEGDYRPAALDDLTTAPSFEGDEPAFAVTAAGTTLRVARSEITAVLEEVRQGGGSYRERRDRFRGRVVDLLLRELVAVAPRRSRDHTIRRELERNRRVERLVERIWPSPSPAEALRTLYDSPQLLRACAGGVLDEAEQAALHRPRAAKADEEPWTLDDRVCLEELRYLITGETPRHYGHIIIDEAQDLTPMQARSLRRRLAASGSMTVLGDLAQATGPHAYTDWDRLGMLLADNGDCRLAELNTSYRVPAEIMRFAAPLARAVAPTLPYPQAVRAAGDKAVQLVETGPDALARETVARVRDLIGTTDGQSLRSVAVIVPDVFEAADEITRRLAEADDIAADERQAITVLPASHAKGLEFDHVLVVEPSAIAGDEPAGLRLLYIALTRSTQSLTIVHSTPLPPALIGTDGHTEPTMTRDRHDPEKARPLAIGTDLRVRVVSVNGGRYKAEALVEHAADRPLYLAVRKDAVAPAVGTELDVWVLRHTANATFVTADDFGRLPMSPTMLRRYRDALEVIEELSRGDIFGTSRARISELKGMATRCLTLDQHDWLDVWRVLGCPDHAALSRLQNLAVSTNHALKSATFHPEVFRAELARSGWADALEEARRTLAQRLATGAEQPKQETGVEEPAPEHRPAHADALPEDDERIEQAQSTEQPQDPEPSQPTEQQPQRPQPEEPDSMSPTPHTVQSAADLARHLETAAVADRTCKTHEAVRHELMAALLRADLQPETTPIVDVSCVTGAGLALYEVLGSGRTSHADLRAGAARLLEIGHTLPTKAERLYLVLCEPPAQPWSADCLRDVFTVDVVWRTTDGWEGSEAEAALGAG